ncbi:hypothetical protein FHG87_001180 [Trinorchestia longiramus]|nr:hypothetical protein FHG87_001180 [Trinorchestia longiramus]
MLWCGGALVLDQGQTYQRVPLDAQPASQDLQQKLVECSRGTEARIVRAGPDAVTLQVASCSIQIMEKDGSTSPVLRLAFSAQPSVIGVYLPFFD